MSVGDISEDPRGPQHNSRAQSSTQWRLNIGGVFTVWELNLCIVQKFNETEEGDMGFQAKGGATEGSMLQNSAGLPCPHCTHLYYSHTSWAWQRTRHENQSDQDFLLLIWRKWKANKQNMTSRFASQKATSKRTKWEGNATSVDASGRTQSTLYSGNKRLS
jgi:hypothetical protein